MTAIHQFVSSTAVSDIIPLNLFVQVNNCLQETENNRFFAYIKWIASCNVLKCKESEFTQEGHWQEDVDQLVKRVSEQVRSTTCITYTKSHYNRWKDNGTDVCLIYMMYVPNCSASCVQDLVLYSSRTFPYCKGFRVSKKSDENSHGSKTKLSCYMKFKIAGNWQPCHMGRDSEACVFIEEYQSFTQLYGLWKRSWWEKEEYRDAWIQKSAVEMMK